MPPLGWPLGHDSAIGANAGLLHARQTSVRAVRARTKRYPRAGERSGCYALNFQIWNFVREQMFRGDFDQQGSAA